MKTSDKCIYVIGIIAIIVMMFISAIANNYFSFCGWLFALMWNVYCLKQESNRYKLEAKYDESVRERFEMRVEIAELKERIREIEQHNDDRR